MNLLPNLKAIAITIHVILVLIMALPGPGARIYDHSRLMAPVVQDEIGSWLSSLGIELEPLHVVLLLRDKIQLYEDGRRALLSPFRAYLAFTGTHQSWRMFSGPRRSLRKMQIDIRTQAEGWQAIYATRSPVLDWRREQFDDNRFRKMVFMAQSTHQRNLYQRLVDWIGRQAAIDFPDAEQIRVRQNCYVSLSPEEVRMGKVASTEWQDYRLVEVWRQ